jgi:hypothetical protein
MVMSPKDVTYGMIWINKSVKLFHFDSFFFDKLLNVAINCLANQSSHTREGECLFLQADGTLKWFPPARE